MPKQTIEPAAKADETTELAADETAWAEPEPATTIEPSWAKAESSPASEPSREEPEPAEAVKPTWPEPTAATESSLAETTEPEPSEPAEPSETSEPAPAEEEEAAGIAASAGGTGDAWWSAPASSAWPESKSSSAQESSAAPQTSAAREEPLPLNGAFFSGDTTFFSLNGALHTIGKNKLTGTLRAFWNQATVDLLARNGEILLVTTRDPQLYCPEAPITLVNVDAEQTERGRAQQSETGCPVFLTLAREELILREPALQLVQHYGQKLFAQLWTAPKVRFVFEQSESLPEFANEVPGEDDIDHWILTTLRCLQFQDLKDTPELESGCIPAYTRDGYQRVQKLRLTVAEAQFASQFNGARSIAQIAKNLRLDFKFARLTLFRFLALEIVECWPPAIAAGKQEKRGFFQRMGFGE